MHNSTPHCLLLVGKGRQTSKLRCFSSRKNSESRARCTLSLRCLRRSWQRESTRRYSAGASGYEAAPAARGVNCAHIVLPALGNCARGLCLVPAADGPVKEGCPSSWTSSNRPVAVRAPPPAVQLQIRFGV